MFDRAVMWIMFFIVIVFGVFTIKNIIAYNDCTVVQYDTYTVKEC